MALIHRTILDSGLIVEQAYIRVQGINGNKNLVAICLEIFVSKQLCDEGKLPIAHLNYTFEPLSADNAPRWDKQSYEYLKTLPEFADAIDA